MTPVAITGQLEQYAVDWVCRQILMTDIDLTDYLTAELFVLVGAISRHLRDAESHIIEYSFNSALSLRIDRLRSALERVEDSLRERFGLVA